MSSRGKYGIVGWVMALFGPLATSGVLVALRSEVPSANAALILVLVVLAAAIIGGRRGGASSAIIAALCFDFFFTRPYYSFTINSRDDLQTTIVLLVVGLVVGELVLRARRSQKLAEARRREVEQIHRIAELAAGSGPAGRLISIVERELVDLTGAQAVRFERPPLHTTLPRLGHGAITIPPENEKGQQRPFGPPNEIELPVWGHGREMGRLVLVLPYDSVGIVIPPEDRALAVALADQLGAVLYAATTAT